MDKDHLFHGKEIDAILKSAARLQTQDKEDKEKAQQGLSLKELEEIASESGIDPVFVRQAAFLGDEDDYSEKKFYLFGAPTSARENFVLNRSLSKRERERLVPSIRKISGVDGFTESLTDSLHWHETRTKRNHPRTSVSILSDGDKSIAQVETKAWFIGFIIHYLAILPAILVGLGVMSEEGFSPQNIGITLAIMATLVMVARFAYSKYHDKRMDKVHQIKSAIKKAADLDSLESQNGSIDLDDLDYSSENLGSNSDTKINTK